MDEHEQTDSVSAEHRIVGSDCFGNNGTGELTATPLKRYVTFLGSRKDGSACKWICNFGCKKEPYTGTYSRIRAHLIGLLPGQKAQGVALCSKVNKNERESMKIEEAEAKRLFGGSSRVPLSAIAKSNTSVTIENQSVVCMSEDTSDVDATVTRFFVANGISFNVAKSPFWFDMVKCINEAPKGYLPPCAKQIKTYLLDNEKDNIDKALLAFKEQWPVCGVSIVSYGWTNIKHQPLISVMAISGGKTMFITSVSCSENQLTSEFISEILLKAIDFVGACNVVQVITDEDAICKSAGEIIEARHPHILWSGCMAHSSSLLLKDMIKSTSSALAFANNAYARAKIIVNFVNNHISTLYQFNTFSELQVFQVKKPRFGSHYVLLERVVQMKSSLINMVLSEEWDFFGKGSTINAEHEQVKRIVLDDDFWCDVKYTLSYTRPLWDMICVCESSKCCIGEIYPRMIEMLENIKVALADKLEIREFVVNLFMERWEMMNRPLHCLAYVLTPYYYSHTWLIGGERRKPHADPYVDKLYLNVVDRLVKNPMERGVIRQQLSEFMSNKGIFARQQAIEDKETMSAITWWDIYGIATNELYNLAVKVLSQTVSTSFSEREWSTYDYIRNVKRNKMNVNRADSLVYVHSNHRLLSRYRNDYEEAYRNWDVYAIDDNLDNDIEAIESREKCLLHDANCSAFQDPIHDSSSDIRSGKRPRLE
ncbi:hypothetical protein ACHQM5_006977 [Ranunculus cassubicifolius]